MFTDEQVASFLEELGAYVEGKLDLSDNVSRSYSHARNFVKIIA